MIYGIAAFNVVFVVLCYIAYRRINERLTKFQQYNNMRLDEIEKYAYTDVRELLEFLDKIKLDYKKYEKTR